jgi:hypothetical protein
MHLKYDNKLFLTIFGISIVFVGLFIILTMFDVQERGAIYDYQGKPINEKAIIYQNPAGDAGKK